MDFWKDEWERCSSAHLRSPKDMQYAMAYYYFLINSHHAFNLSSVFEIFDRDRDGYPNLLFISDFSVF